VNRKPIFDALRDILGRPILPGEVGIMDAAIDAALGTAKAPHKLTDPTAFFASAKAAFGPLKQTQVDGMNRLLAAMGAVRWPIAWAAYGLATAWHETAHTLQPVREAYWKTEAWRKANLRYWPWYGRGDVQLTWQGNYERADEALGLDGTLVANPDRAMEPEISSRILVWGMEGGCFTGKKLADYLPLSGGAGHSGYKNARRIINGTDKADQIAKHALSFEAALEAGGWG
jgi:putative chitinase